MGSISQEDIQKVREASDLVAIVGERTPLRQRGRDFWCCCPFHNEKTPSFKIDPSTQLWHCFGCGEGGDVFGFIMKSEDLSFPDAVRYLADRAHIEIVEEGGPRGPSSGQKARLKAVCAETADFYHRQLMRARGAGPDSARSYLQSRQMGGAIPNNWMLGYAPGRGVLVRHLRAAGFTNEEMLQANVAVERKGSVQDRFYDRIIFPINDVQGDCIAFGGRVIGKGEPKYLNSQETPLFHKSQVLYGLDKAKGAIASTGTAIVTEGYTDVIIMYEAGIKNVVATLGTALTTQHIRTLSRHAKHRIVYLFDGDAAGRHAADRAVGFIDAGMTSDAGRSRIDLYAVTIPDNLDPVDFIQQRGVDALKELLDEAKPLVQYGIDRRLEDADLSSAEGRAAACADALSVLAPIKDSLVAKEYARQIAYKTQMREDDVLDMLHGLKAPAPRGQAEDQGRDEASVQSAQEARRAEAAKLPSAEVDRRNFERQLLCLCAQHPEVALAHADVLAQTHWHDEACAGIAGSILDTLAEDPAATPARIVSDASLAQPSAAGILTAPLSSGTKDLEVYGNYLCERIVIDDEEEQIDALQARMNDPAGISEEESEMLYQVASSLQQDVKRRRAALEEH